MRHARNEIMRTEKPLSLVLINYDYELLIFLKNGI